MNQKPLQSISKLFSICKEKKNSIKQIIYVLILVGITILLIRLGKQPWIIAIENWPSFFILTLSTAIGLVIQAQSFKSVSAGQTPPLLEITRIWSLSSIISVVAPFFAGIATRTAFLVQQGMAFTNCLASSLRQAWLGVEYALIAGAITLPAIEFSYNKELSIALFISWLALRISRRKIATKKYPSAFKRSIKKVSEIWFALQVLIMSMTFFVGFNAIGAKISFEMAIAISALTILVSLITFVPNGLGITDTIWIIISTKYGIGLAESVSLSILLRASHLMGSALTLFISELLKRLLSNRKNTRRFSSH